MVTLKIKIYNIEKIMDIFVIDDGNFNYDFLIGLDCIKKFKLIQNEELKIIQYNNLRDKQVISKKENNMKINDYSKNDN